MSRRQRQWSMPRWSWERHRIQSALTFAILGITMSDFITLVLYSTLFVGNRHVFHRSFLGVIHLSHLPYQLCVCRRLLSSYKFDLSLVSTSCSLPPLCNLKGACVHDVQPGSGGTNAEWSRSRAPSVRFQAGPLLSALSDARIPITNSNCDFACVLLHPTKENGVRQELIVPTKCEESGIMHCAAMSASCKSFLVVRY